MEDIEILDEDEKVRLFAVKNVKYIQPVLVRYLFVSVIKTEKCGEWVFKYILKHRKSQTIQTVSIVIS